MSTSARFPVSPLNTIEAGQDNTDRIRNNEFLNPAYAATIALVPTKSYTLVQINLTGALTLTAGVGSASTAPYVGDKIEFIFGSDAARVVTFGTGFVPNGTLTTITGGKGATASFMFNGVAWIELGRTIQP